MAECLELLRPGVRLDLDLWISAVATGGEVTRFPTVVVFALGGIGAVVSAFALTTRDGGPEACRALLRSTTAFREIPARWWMAIVVIALAPNLIGVLIGVFWVFWAVWHFPLYFIEDTFHKRQGIRLRGLLIPLLEHRRPGGALHLDPAGDVLGRSGGGGVSHRR